MTDPALPKPQPPVEPHALDCCNSECGDACVWSIYRLAQNEYERALETWQLSQLD